ncbi:GGDEF domain-containing protein [Lacrimispora algidixylanolytica]|uniref:Diguanylate cyclase n=1 Tax=Lacrimispora algidixylanolytica TaxID=94868 RepID=A0A419SUP3_9FIRM|nr:GGDEF domain-containing protein [Lacrimispora algidixylanolytica]RKD28943.1 diguanylate cyclase [Lacrimispora algidixylanolytica]
MDRITLNEIKDKLDFFHKMFDAVRLIDPLHKKVIECQDSDILITKEVCYHYWGDKKICDNCISMRSYQEDKSLVKMEKSQNAVFLVTAIPITTNESPAVLELLKNVTDTMFVGSGEYNKSEMLSRYVEEISNAIIKDPLTLLFNRRFVEERLPADIVESTLANRPLSLCFLDLDNFKAINDTYGHGAGDKAIKTVSEIIISNIDCDKSWAARYGGDEFLVCLNGTREEDAQLIMKKIQRDVGNLPIYSEKDSIKLSLTYGIKTMEDIPLTAAELIREADKVMYLAKQFKYHYGQN